MNGSLVIVIAIRLPTGIMPYDVFINSIKSTEIITKNIMNSTMKKDLIKRLLR